MAKKSMLLGAVLLAGASLGMFGAASAAPVGMAGSAISQKALAGSQEAANSDLIIKTQARRRVGGVGRVAPAGRVGRVGGGGFRRGGRGISSGAAVGIGAAAIGLGLLGAAAAANAEPVYGGCYFVRQPVYDDWGNYLGRRRVRVCE